MKDIYCEKILTGELKVKVLEETEHALAFEHSAPYWEKHVVVIPKKHIESFTDNSEEDSSIIMDVIEVAKRVAKSIEQELGGCRMSTNIGSYQSSKHLHFYIHAGERLRDEDGSTISK